MSAALDKGKKMTTLEKVCTVMLRRGFHVTFTRIHRCLRMHRLDGKWRMEGTLQSSLRGNPLPLPQTQYPLYKSRN